MGGMTERGGRKRLDWLLGVGVALVLLGIAQIAYGTPAGLFVAILGGVLIAASALRTALSRR